MIHNDQINAGQASNEFAAALEKRRGKYKTFSDIVKKEYPRIEPALREGIASLDEILIDLCNSYQVEGTKAALKSALQRIRDKQRAVRVLKAVTNVDVEPYLQKMGGDNNGYPPPQRGGGYGGSAPLQPQPQMGWQQGYAQPQSQPTWPSHGQQDFASQGMPNAGSLFQQQVQPQVPPPYMQQPYGFPHQNSNGVGHFNNQPFAFPGIANPPPNY